MGSSQARRLAKASFQLARQYSKHSGSKVRRQPRHLRLPKIALPEHKCYDLAQISCVCVLTSSDLLRVARGTRRPHRPIPALDQATQPASPPPARQAGSRKLPLTACATPVRRTHLCSCRRQRAAASSAWHADGCASAQPARAGTGSRHLRGGHDRPDSSQGRKRGGWRGLTLAGAALPSALRDLQAPDAFAGLQFETVHPRCPALTAEPCHSRAAGCSSCVGCLHRHRPSRSCTCTSRLRAQARCQAQDLLQEQV